MSGGVDSSVAAARVRQRGFNAFAVTLALWPGSAERTRDRGCCSVDAVEDARRVAAAVGLPHYVWNLEGEFEAAVIRPFEDAYAAGVTPNPCTRCNEQVKFGLLLQRVLAAGATHLATGHYARAGRRDGTATLHRATDGRRDQSYVLHRLGQDQLRRAVFPVGAVASKAALRAEAEALGLATAAKPESQDLCFVETTMSADLSQRLAGRFRPGPIVDGEGRRLGTHRGLPFYTVGQRSGLDIAATRPDAAPRYVAEIRSSDNTLVVGPREALQRTVIDVAGCSWVGGAPAPGTQCVLQVRAHGTPHEALLVARGDGTARLSLAQPAAQVSPGQAAVVYAGDEVLGGGVIAGAA